MKKVFVYLLFATLLNINAQDVINKKASKLFFLNNQFGVLVNRNNGITVTKNGGEFWEQINIDTKERLKAALFTSETNGWLLGDSSIFKTVDGGSTWIKNHSFRTDNLYSLYFINDNIGFIGYQDIDSVNYASTVFYTHDSGLNWHKASLDTNLSSGILDFSFVSDSTGIAVSPSTIYKTNNMGLSWNKLPINFYLGGKMPGFGEMVDEENIILTTSEPHVVSEGSLLKSTDGGITWGNYGNSQFFKWGIRDAFVLSQDSIWLTTGESIYFTENSGNNWDTLDIQLEYFSFVSNKQAYGITGEYILYTADGWKTNTIITDVKENREALLTFKLYQNYPNPFNPTTKIRFEIPKRDYVHINIYNLLGEKILELYNGEIEQGSHEIIFDASNLSNGIYFYQIRASEYQQTKKCILLK